MAEEPIWFFSNGSSISLKLASRRMSAVSYTHLDVYKRQPYINNMPQLLAAADLVIARSGALTLAELEAVGRASILIPSPNVAENHQYYNALELQKAGAAVVIEEKNLTGEGLIETVQQLLAQPGKLAEMGANAKTLGNPHSLELITCLLYTSRCV